MSVKNGEYFAKGGGFGDFYRRGIIKRVRLFPTGLLSSYLLRKHKCQKYIIDAGKRVYKKTNTLFNFDGAKAMLSLNTIINKINKYSEGYGGRFNSEIKTVCIIGDGYAFFSNLLRQINPSIKVISINLGKTLLFDVLYSKACFPEINTALIRSIKDKELILKNELSFIEAENYHLLEDLPIDMFVNSASMQEINPEIIETIMKNIVKENHFQLPAKR